MLTLPRLPHRALGARAGAAHVRVIDGQHRFPRWIRPAPPRSPPFCRGQRNRRGGERRLPGHLPCRRPLIECRDAARRVDDEHAARARLRQEPVHWLDQLPHPRGRRLAPVVIPHVAHDHGRPTRIPVRRSGHRLPRPRPVPFLSAQLEFRPTHPTRPRHGEATGQRDEHPEQPPSGNHARSVTIHRPGETPNSGQAQTAGASCCGPHSRKIVSVSFRRTAVSGAKRAWVHFPMASGAERNFTRRREDAKKSGRSVLLSLPCCSSRLLGGFEAWRLFLRCSFCGKKGENKAAKPPRPQRGKWGGVCRPVRGLIRSGNGTHGSRRGLSSVGAPNLSRRRGRRWTRRVGTGRSPTLLRGLCGFA